MATRDDPSRRDDEKTANKQVVDEDGDVDAKLKDTIIQARNRIDETRNALDVQAPLQPEVQIDAKRRQEMFAKTVKQYLIRIEPLLRSDEISGNEAYYKGGEEPLAVFRLVPQDKDGYKFSLVERDLPDPQLRKMIGLPPNVDLPEPREVVLWGLKDVIEEPHILRHEWEVCVKKDGAPPNWEYAYPFDVEPIPEQVYMNAIRESDQFLQEIGIGIETGLPETDEEGEPF